MNWFSFLGRRAPQRRRKPRGFQSPQTFILEPILTPSAVVEGTNPQHDAQLALVDHPGLDLGTSDLSHSTDPLHSSDALQSDLLSLPADHLTHSSDIEPVAFVYDATHITGDTAHPGLSDSNNTSHTANVDSSSYTGFSGYGYGTTQEEYSHAIDHTADASNSGVDETSYGSSIGYGYGAETTHPPLINSTADHTNPSSLPPAIDLGHAAEQPLPETTDTGHAAPNDAAVQTRVEPTVQDSIHATEPAVPQGTADAGHVPAPTLTPVSSQPAPAAVDLSPHLPTPAPEHPVQDPIGLPVPLHTAHPQPLIGIIDTGFAPHNPTVASGHVLFGHDFVGGDDNPLESGQGAEHGSHILNIITDTRADAANPSPIWLGRAIGSGHWADSLTEFVDAAKASGQPHAVVNLSFDLTQTHPDGTVSTRDVLTPQEWQALAYAHDNGVLVVAASGNTGGQMSALGQASLAFDNILTVGAANGSDSATYSSTGTGLDLLAPGHFSGEDMTGSSVAAAEVTGAVSQVWAVNPALSYRQVASILKSTATDIKDAGWDLTTGFGLVDVAAAMTIAKFTLPDDEPILPVTAAIPPETELTGISDERAASADDSEGSTDGQDDGSGTNDGNSNPGPTGGDGSGITPNDNLVDAIALNGALGTVLANNTTATGEPDEPEQSGDLNSLWWSWTAPEDGTLTLDTNNSDFPTCLSLFTGSGASVADLTIVTQSDGGTMQCPVQAGTTYYIAVDGVDNRTGNITLNYAFVPTPPEDGSNSGDEGAGNSGSGYGDDSPPEPVDDLQPWQNDPDRVAYVQSQDEYGRQFPSDAYEYFEKLGVHSSSSNSGGSGSSGGGGAGSGSGYGNDGGGGGSDTYNPPTPVLPDIRLRSLESFRNYGTGNGWNDGSTVALEYAQCKGDYTNDPVYSKYFWKWDTVLGDFVIYTPMIDAAHQADVDFWHYIDEYTSRPDADALAYYDQAKQAYYDAYWQSYNTVFPENLNKEPGPDPLPWGGNGSGGGGEGGTQPGYLTKLSAIVNRTIDYLNGDTQFQSAPHEAAYQERLEELNTPTRLAQLGTLKEQLQQQVDAILSVGQLVDQVRSNDSEAPQVTGGLFSMANQIISYAFQLDSDAISFGDNLHYGYYGYNQAHPPVKPTSVQQTVFQAKLRLAAELVPQLHDLLNSANLTADLDELAEDYAQLNPTPRDASAQPLNFFLDTLWNAQTVGDLQKGITELQTFVSQFDYPQDAIKFGRRLIKAVKHVPDLPQKHDPELLANLLQLAGVYANINPSHTTQPGGTPLNSFLNTLWTLDTQHDGLSGQRFTAGVEQLATFLKSVNDSTQPIEPDPVKLIKFTSDLLAASEQAGKQSPQLHDQVQDAAFLKELTGLAKAYAAIDPSIDSSAADDEGDPQFFLNTLWQPQSDINKASLEFSSFTKEASNLTQLIQYQQKLLLALKDVPKVQKFIQKPEFLSEMATLGNLFTRLQPTETSTDGLYKFFSNVWTSNSKSDLQTASNKLEVLLAHAEQDQSSSGSTPPPQAVQLDSEDSDVEDIISALNRFTQANGFDDPTGVLAPYRIFNIAAYNGDPNYVVTLNANIDEPGYATIYRQNEEDTGIYPTGTPIKHYSINGEIVPYYVLHNGQLSYYPAGVQATIYPTDKILVPRINQASSSAPPLFTQAKQDFIIQTVQQVIGVSRTIGDFILGAIYQYTADQGEPLKALLSIDPQDKRTLEGLENNLEFLLQQQSVAFQAGRIFGDGASVIAGLLEVFAGGSAAIAGGAGASSFVIPGIGEFTGPSAVAVAAVGVAVIAHGVGTIKAALEGLIEHTGAFLAITGGSAEDEYSSDLSAMPRRSRIDELVNNYPGLSRDEAYALEQTSLQHVRGRATGRRIFSENELAKFLGIKKNQANLPEGLIEKQNGNFIAVEVKNQGEPSIGNAIASFEDVTKYMANRSEPLQVDEFKLYVNKDIFRNFSDQGYTIGGGRFLFYLGELYRLPTSGKTVQVVMTDFQPIP